MGLKSTYTLTRETAEMIIKEIDLHEVSNEALSEILELFPQSEFRNYYIVGDWETTDINSFQDFENL